MVGVVKNQDFHAVVDHNIRSIGRHHPDSTITLVLSVMVEDGYQAQAIRPLREISPRVRVVLYDESTCGSHEAGGINAVLQIGAQAEVSVIMQTSMWLHRKMPLPLECGMTPLWFFNSHWFNKRFEEDAEEEGRPHHPRGWLADACRALDLPNDGME